MQLSEIQQFCRQLLSRVTYPRVGTIIGLQEELGKLAETIMTVEIYGKPLDRKELEKRCSEVFFSLVDLCNSYDVKLEKISKTRIEEMKRKIQAWEKEHGESLSDRRKKLD